jgi:hypothetical protein
MIATSSSNIDKAALLFNRPGRFEGCAVDVALISYSRVKISRLLLPALFARQDA